MNISPMCPVCSMDTTQPLCISYGYEVLRCRSCCSDFVWPLPDPSVLKAYYDGSSYFQGDKPGSYANYDLDTEAVLPLYRELLQEISGGTRRSILDIGCAYGTHLSIAAEQGWDACGVELSDHARQVALQRHGDKISVFQSLEDIPSREFDLITLFDVIEHLPNPYEILDTLFCRGLIGKHTVVALTTPNARSTEAVLDPQNWAYRHPPAHLIYYSAQSLRTFWTLMGACDIDIKGVYEVDQPEPAVFPDETSGLNLRTQGFAGLLCVAGNFDASLRSLLQMRSAALLGEKAEAQRIRDLLAVEKELRRMEDLLVAESEKLQRASRELQTLRQTKWFRLRDALVARPMRQKNILRAIHLVMSMTAPGPVRALFRRLASRPISSAVMDAKQIEPYVVRAFSPALSSRPRVVHVIANFMTGGSSRLVVDLIEGLGDRFDQRVLTSFAPNPPAYVGVEITELRHPQSEASFVEYFEHAKPKFIHMHYWGDVDEPWYANAVSAAEKLGIPIVENVNTPVQPFFSGIVKHYVYVSGYVRETFGRAGPAHVTIYPGSDFSHFSRESNEERAADCVGMVYRLERDKLDESAILPFIAAVKKRPKTRVLIVGGGALLPSFERAVADAGVANNFEFTGYVSYADLPDMYRRMSVFVAPVWKESFGQVSPFAMNMGIPVCGYDVGAIGEIVEDRSLVAPPGDADMLADIMIRLLDSPEEHKWIGEKQRLRAQAYFSVEAMVRAYADVYRELTDNVPMPL